ncbi:MAG: DMT family transporter [Betaproteobacteria bacterium]|nr:DMT family transporter [Betaproteobacteria bacterium]
MAHQQTLGAATGTRAFAFSLLAFSNLFWAGNWVTGRALRDAFDPVTLNFWRWLIAALILAPFALPALAGQRDAIRRSAGLLALLALTGVALFQSLVYLGLRTTTTVNAVLLNSSAPLFMLLCSWSIERERGTRRQVVGMLISLAGILVILSRGELGNLLQLEFHPGDAWILLAMPAWGVYSVLVKRRPPELGGAVFLFLISVAGVLLLAPAFALAALHTPPRWPTTGEAAGVLYVALAASVGAFLCWNRGVAIVGANAAGFTLHLLPAFGTVLAMVFLGEAFQAFHAAGIATILLGVIVATRAAPAPN